MCVCTHNIYWLFLCKDALCVYVSHYICIQIGFLRKTVKFWGWEGFFIIDVHDFEINPKTQERKKGKSFWRGAAAEPKESQLAGCTSGLWILPILGLGKKLEASFCSFFSDPVHKEEEKSMGAKPEKRRASVSFCMLLKVTVIWSQGCTLQLSLGAQFSLL